MRWFNVCLSMHKPPALFDALLRPDLENPRVTIIHFILDEDQRRPWEEILPTIRACPGAHKIHWRGSAHSPLLPAAASSARVRKAATFWAAEAQITQRRHLLPQQDARIRKRVHLIHFSHLHTAEF